MWQDCACSLSGWDMREVTGTLTCVLYECETWDTVTGPTVTYSTDVWDVSVSVTWDMWQDYACSLSGWDMRDLTGTLTYVLCAVWVRDMRQCDRKLPTVTYSTAVWGVSVDQWPTWSLRTQYMARPEITRQFHSNRWGLNYWFYLWANDMGTKCVEVLKNLQVQKIPDDDKLLTDPSC